jgi:hypothetical protein
MRDFESYFSFYSIVDQLATHRAKLSFYVHKHIYLERFCERNKWQINDQEKINDQEFLKTILPPRKDWCRPKGHFARKPFGSSIDLNKASIKRRIKITHEKFVTGTLNFKDTPEWYKKLRYFVFELNIQVFQNINFKLEKPNIFPAKKKPEDKSNTERRPLAKSCLKDKLVLSLVNKYLTKAFDPLFLPYSYAFRAQNDSGLVPSYHDAVKALQEFRNLNIGQKLYATECDIKKFFDCLDHEVIKKYYSLHWKALEEKGVILHPAAERIFLSYLKFYSFGKDVYPKNHDAVYWKEMQDDSPRGQFGWVEEMIKKSAEVNSPQIGVPQGGALSGLIVNMVMHAADLEVCKNEGIGKEFLYLRYCDDMVIVHKDPKECRVVFNSYIKKLGELELITHEWKDHMKKYSKEFWNDVKSRDVYLWSKTRDPSFINSPWISFLGYLIGDMGDLKVRKRSLQKQKDKHNQEINKIIKKLNYQTDENLLANKESIYHSVSHKMASMAIGKIDVRDYKTSPVKMCWAAGFKLLEYNKYSGQQLRLMDKSRQQSLIQLRKYLKKRTAVLEEIELTALQKEGKNSQNSEKSSEEDEKKKRKEEVIFTQYPHSFYSMLDRANKK